MQSVTSLFNTLWGGSHRAVVKAVINDSVTIGEDKITNLKTDGALFAENDFSFGGCISRQFEMSFYPGNITIPRMAKVQLYMQLTNGTQTSEWISKGIFYIDTRETDSNGLMKITGYDAMLKTEQDFIPTSTPQSMQATASQIATAIGVSLDSRCVFQNYNCQLVIGYSMREILGFIAGVHGGNWIITDVGNLRLVRTSSSVDSITITNRELMSYNKGSTYASISKVIINIDDDTYVEAGDTTGRTVEVTCPWATTAMAQALLTQLRTYSYTPCTASVLLHPAAEIGDKFIVSSISHCVATQTLHFNSLFLSELEVPGEEEIDHEYPFESASERTANRKIATVVAETAELRVTTQQISARVEDVEGDVATISLTVTSLSSRITSAEGDISALEQTAASLISRITSAEGDITTLEQTTTSISATVSGKADKTAGTASTFSYSLTATGFTLFSNADEVMIVTSSGAHIGGWSITASKIYHPYVTGNDGVGMIYSGGAPRPSLWQSGDSPVVFYAGAEDDIPYPDSEGDCYFGVLQDGSVYCQAIKATGGQIGNWILQNGSLSYTDETEHQHGTGYASISVDGISFGNSSGVAKFSPAVVYINENLAVLPSSNYARRQVLIDYSGLYLNFPDFNTISNYDKHFVIGYDDKTYIRYTAVFKAGSIWNGTRAEMIGTWYYGSSGVAYASARLLKKDIKEFDARHNRLFDNLIPRTFVFRNGESGRTHYGYILDEVRNAMDIAGLQSGECGAYCLYDIDNPNGEGGIRYEEFISLNTWQIQKLKARVAHLEELLTAQGVQV